jgi:hypothetical protein
MKSSLIIGILFLILGSALAYVQYYGSNEPFLTFTLIIGILVGAGLGLVVGAIGGYSSKAQSVKRKTRAEREIRSKIEDTSSTGTSESQP